MKRTARMEYQLNDQRSHVITRRHLVRNPVEVGVDVETTGTGDLVHITLQVFVDGTYELRRDGDVVHVGAVS